MDLEIAHKLLLKATVASAYRSAADMLADPASDAQEREIMAMANSVAESVLNVTFSESPSLSSQAAKE